VPFGAELRIRIIKNNSQQEELVEVKLASLRNIPLG
jgi:hypothetical protein